METNHHPKNTKEGTTSVPETALSNNQTAEEPIKKSRNRRKKDQKHMRAIKLNENNGPIVDESLSNKTSMKHPLQSSQLASITGNPLRKPSLSRKNAGTNWSNVLAAVNVDEVTAISPNATEVNNVATEGAVKQSRNRRKKQQRVPIVAMDCEMVGIGPMGSDDMLARVSIVNKNGDVLLDKFVKPRQPVTNYRTSVSGIRPQDIEHAEEFDKVQDEVIELLQGKILVGHGIRNDLDVLFIRHPYLNIRDTARYKPLARLVSNGRTPSLKRLSQAILGVEIQKGEHNSVEDARAAMNVYNRLSADWEKYIKKQSRSK